MYQSIPAISNLFAKTNLIKRLTLILFAVVVLAIASQLSIPFTPIPLTFQSATVILIAMAYGSRHGSAVILAYLFAGLCGLPVFANLSFGPTALNGPTGGYLLGFLPAAFIAGALSEHGFGRHVFSAFLIALLSAAIIFACGVPVLAAFIGWQHAILLGLKPFIVTEIIKLLVVAAVIPRLWKHQ